MSAPQTNQGARQASVESATGTTLTYNGDWMALFTKLGIPDGDFDGRMLAWINLSMSASYTNLPQAQQAYATSQGFYNWSSMGTFTAGSPPVNTVAPIISGTNIVGQILSTTNGTWTNSPTSYTYQWQTGGVDIGGATSSTYTIQAGDAGNSLTCNVTAHNASGTGTAASNAISIQIAGTAGPTIVQTAYSAHWVTASDIAWTNPSNITLGNGSYATVSMTTNQFSDWIVGQMGSNAFSIPSDARIDGIEVSYAGTASGGSGGQVFIEDHVQLSLNGSSGNPRAIGVNLWNTSSRGLGPGTAGTPQVVGGSTELWGLNSITPAMVNDATFGAMLRLKRPGSTLTADLDYIKVKIYYTRYVNLPTEVVGTMMGTIPYSATGLSGSFDFPIVPSSNFFLFVQPYINSAQYSNAGNTNFVTRSDTQLSIGLTDANSSTVSTTSFMAHAKGIQGTTNSQWSQNPAITGNFSRTCSLGAVGQQGGPPVAADPVVSSLSTNYIRCSFTAGATNPATSVWFPISAARGFMISGTTSNAPSAQGVTNVSSIGYQPQLFIMVSGEEHNEVVTATGHNQWLGANVGFGKWRNDGSTYGVYDYACLQQAIQVAQNNIGIGNASTGNGEVPHGYIGLFQGTSPTAGSPNVSNAPMQRMNDFWTTPDSPTGTSLLWSASLAAISGGVQILWDNVPNAGGGNGFAWIGFDVPSGYDSWIGLVTMPTSTGVHTFGSSDFTAIGGGSNSFSFKPSSVLLVASMCQDVGTLHSKTSDGSGLALINILSRAVTSAGCASRCDQSADTTFQGTDYIDRTQLHLLKYDGTAAYIGTISGDPFVAGGWTVNLTTVDGTARVWLALAIGKT
jgi:hypothetical protein